MFYLLCFGLYSWGLHDFLYYFISCCTLGAVGGDPLRLKMQQVHGGAAAKLKRRADWARDAGTSSGKKQKSSTPSVLNFFPSLNKGN
jgi:hypothetical protein